MPQGHKIALVRSGIYDGGGVSSVCSFLYQAISSVGRYDVHLFSLEASYDGPNSVRLLSPKSWFQGVQITEYAWNTIPVKHVGARWSEFEFQRYKPRRTLTSLLNQYDLIQFVSGSPVLANVARNVDRPICLFMATLTKLERRTVLRNTSLLRKIYGRTMLPIISRMEIQGLKTADHIFAETEYSMNAILPYAASSKIQYDTIGVDTDRFHPVSEDVRTNDYILSVGRFGDPRKNVTMLFQSYALLRQHFPDAPPLILAGKTGPSLSAWSLARELGISQQVSYKHDVSLDELINLYQNAAVCVLSSDEEGLGIVLLEAMACATPVVSTRCGGPDVVVTDQVGFLTPVGDPHYMAERLSWILRNPTQQRKMGLVGRQMVRNRFSAEKVGRKYLDVYDRLLGVIAH